KDLKRDFNDWISNLGRSKDKEVKVVAGAVGLVNKAGKPLIVPDTESPERPAYDALQAILTDPLKKDATAIQVGLTEEGAAVRYTVDGMPYEGAKLNRNESGGAIELLKRLAGLDIEEKRKPQTGTVKATLDKSKKEMSVTTRGSTAGETAAIEVNKKNWRMFTLDQTGMTESQIKQVDKVLAEPAGIVLVAAQRGGGLRSLLYALGRKHDAFLLHIQTLEHAPEDELEGFTQNKLPADAAPGEMKKMASWIASQEPDVLIVDRVDDAEAAAELIDLAGRGKRIYIGIRAGNTLDALTMWRKQVGNDKLAVKHLQLIIAQRLIRKLCAACKLEYAPDPDTLRKLNMSPDKVGSLYQARTQPLRDPKGNPLVCEFCHDLHFRGRTGVYELLLVDDEVRQIIETGASPNQLKMQFKKQKQKSLQENAVATAIAGDTSLQEVARILKSDESRSRSESRAKA
ncbi:MAG: Flp pilus assembly complex ATPase component TadA, partial [Phycisphaerae bacterium]|nr:Flp pilus assembly complex ATPase component TadA [Phycisphaerae bacterium]